MMFLYYYLAKSEERICIRLFGAELNHAELRTRFAICEHRELLPGSHDGIVLQNSVEIAFNVTFRCQL